MNFRDQQLTCAVCGKAFIFTVTEQRRLYESGQEVVTPEQCPSCRLIDPRTGRGLGRIKWFSYEKGYGFIVKPNGDELFFHRSQVAAESLSSLEEGAQVRFDQVEGGRGPEAHQVELATS